MGIVKNPMDLSTIKRRLEADYYEEYQSVYSDVKLMFENCCLYNPPGHDVVKMAKKAEILAEKRWNEFLETLSDDSANDEVESDEPPEPIASKPAKIQETK